MVSNVRKLVRCDEGNVIKSYCIYVRLNYYSYYVKVYNDVI
ncbi:hypothetical protein CNEO2_490005 [Clostridium neonatale]|nr:hypothetical protein CNEO2_490005 [Clostridium neonatale]CAI3693013.1 hypothetical protein CNEO2_510032 [Clostridium neonatale]